MNKKGSADSVQGEKSEDRMEDESDEMEVEEDSCFEALYTKLTAFFEELDPDQSVRQEKKTIYQNAWENCERSE